MSTSLAKALLIAHAEAMYYLKQDPAAAHHLKEEFTKPQSEIIRMLVVIHQI